MIRGTRIPVDLLVRKIVEGVRDDDLLDAYPVLTQDDLDEARAWAAQASRVPQPQPSRSDR